MTGNAPQVAEPETLEAEAATSPEGVNPPLRAASSLVMRATGQQISSRQDSQPARTPSLAPVLTARPLRRGMRVYGKLLSFLAVVVLPTVMAAVYFIGFATPQYVSEFKFGVRSANALRNDATALFQGAAAASQIGLDSYVVTQFIKSRELVDAIRHEFDFTSLFGRPDIDPLARLDSRAQSETVQHYWDAMVDPFFDLTTGSVSVRVRAFAPLDAQNLAKSILVRSERLVNDLSLRSREDAVKHARDEVSRAEARLRQSLAAIRTFRDTQARINPEKEADNRMLALGRLRDELVKANAELSVRQNYVSGDSPTIKAINNRIKALKEQIAIAERELTNSGAVTAEPNVALSAVIGTYDVLESERRFAEDYYKTTLISLERSRAEADKQLSYLATFVQPTLPEEATYPRVLQSISIVLIAGFGLWIFGLIAVRSIREHS